MVYSFHDQKYEVSRSISTSFPGWDPCLSSFAREHPATFQLANVYHQIILYSEEILVFNSLQGDFYILPMGIKFLAILLSG